MAVTIFVVQLLALMYITIGVAAIRGVVKYNKLLKDLTQPGLAMMVGITSMSVGLYLVQYHNVWVQDWPVIVTIVGWAALLKGFLYTAFPDKLAGMFKGKFKNIQALGYGLVVVGIALAYLGFQVL